ncbi:hypothetical protein MNBD_GAMMA12-1429 [hydrothermal vent metagenome]|uniref:Transmembrane protein n=1 Tax=hydrothermal vent metagenome TaxID=652676 RepID=A0A3B0XS13_9ZZZZ
MIDDNKIKQKLQSANPPENIETDIHHAWQQSQNAPIGSIRNYWPAYSVLSLVGIITILWLNLSVLTPSIVTTAIEDIQKDAFTGIGLTEKYQPWLAQRNIKLPPSKMTVTLSKFCQLAGRLSFHLKIAGERRGHVHLFILNNKPEMTAGNLSGKIASLSWRIIKPHANLYVLVLFTKDMKQESVNTLIQNMFYA